MEILFLRHWLNNSHCLIIAEYSKSRMVSETGYLHLWIKRRRSGKYSVAFIDKADVPSWHLIVKTKPWLVLEIRHYNHTTDEVQLLCHWREKMHQLSRYSKYATSQITWPSVCGSGKRIFCSSKHSSWLCGSPASYSIAGTGSLAGEGSHRITPTTQLYLVPTLRMSGPRYSKCLGKIAYTWQA